MTRLIEREVSSQSACPQIPRIPTSLIPSTNISHRLHNSSTMPLLTGPNAKPGLQVYPTIPGLYLATPTPSSMASTPGKYTLFSQGQSKTSFYQNGETSPSSLTTSRRRITAAGPIISVHICDPVSGMRYKGMVIQKSRRRRDGMRHRLPVRGLRLCINLLLRVKFLIRHSQTTFL